MNRKKNMGKEREGNANFQYFSLGLACKKGMQSFVGLGQIWG